MMKRRIVLLGLALSLLGQVGVATAEDGAAGPRPLGVESIMFDTEKWGELNTHDPSIYKDGDTYYVFSTDASYGDVHPLGVQIRKSTDLITWTYVGPAFANFAEDCAEAIAYAKLDPEKKQGLWAPDITKEGDVYRLYFSASTFGSSRSCIGLAEAEHIEGPYTYKGIVLKSEAGALNGANAIDPQLVYDTEGRLYMSYGSFFGGIFIRELDRETGFFKDTGAKPVRIAGSRGASVEGSVISYLPESGYYYLFVSYGSLSSNYNIRVGRSRDVMGPYLDANGKDMASLGPGGDEKVGTKLLGGYTFQEDPGVPATKGYMAPGHNSILVDGEDRFIVHHVRMYKLPSYWFTMNVRRFVLNAYDWPVVAPQRYHGEALEAMDWPEGAYNLVQHGRDSNAESHDAQRIEMVGGVVSGAVSGTYEVYDGWRMRLTLEDVAYDGVMLSEYDAEREAPVVSFTAMSEDGLCVWGTTCLSLAGEK